MADFGPFASDAERRSPTTLENSDGFPCGPLDQPLFNGMMHRIEAELKNIQDAGGVIGAAGQFDQVLEAILNLISAAVGPDTSGDTSNFVLMSQARLRLPIFPDVITPTNGIIGVISTGAGNVRLPAGAKFLHRGIFEITTSLTDFLTDPNKVYHLRWNPTDGFQLIDTTDGVYNPTALAESNAAFDSKYDDMLIARVVTNAGNNPTITNLVNKHDLIYDGQVTGPGGTSSTTIWYDGSFTLNWARTPFISIEGVTVNSIVQPGNWYENFANSVGVTTRNRYLVAARVATDLWAPVPVSATLSGILRLFAKA